MAMRTGRMSIRLRTWIVSTLLLLSSLSAPTFLQPLSGAPQDRDKQPATPVLRTITRLVQLNVIATDKKGEPVADLTAADFVVLDNGRPQTIKFFRKETDQPPANSPHPLPPDTYTNQIRQTASVPASVTILLLDGLNTNISDQAYARQQAIKFLEQIHPQDRLAVFTLARDLHVLQDLTGDSSKLVAALGKYFGQTTMDLDASTPADVQAGDQTMDALLQDAFQREANMYIQDRVQITMAALIDIANYVAAFSGRKNLLWVSGSFPFSVGYDNLQTIAQMVNDPKREANITGQQLMFAEDIERAARALNDANIAVYPVDARGLLGLNMNTAKGTSKTPGYGAMNGGQQSGNPGGGGRGGFLNGPKAGRPGQSSSLKQGPSNPILDLDKTTFETMDALANGTGGKASYNSNNIISSLHSAIEDSRVTYEIGYYPADEKWDGSFHSITLHVAKPDVAVRARKGYFALPQPEPTPQDLRGIMTGALASPLESTAMGLAVRVKATTGDEGTALSAMIFFDPRAIHLDFGDEHFTGTANIAVAQLNARNQLLGASQQSFPLNFTHDQYQQFLKQQVELTQDIDVLPSATQLRVVLCDGKTGKVGSVAIPLAKYLAPK